MYISPISLFCSSFDAHGTIATLPLHSGPARVWNFRTYNEALPSVVCCTGLAVGFGIFWVLPMTLHLPLPSKDCVTSCVMDRGKIQGRMWKEDGEVYHGGRPLGATHLHSWSNHLTNWFSFLQSGTAILDDDRSSEHEFIISRRVRRRVRMSPYNRSSR